MGVDFESDHRFIFFVIHHVRQTTGVCGLNAPVRSKASPARRIISSANGGAINCMPIGRLFESYPHGIAMPGKPARFTEIVKMSDRYIVSGSFIFSPSLKAVVGATGVTIKSHCSKARSKSLRIRVRTFCPFR